MERNQVLEEYRKLCNLLNQGNKLTNEKTEIKFTIESVRPSEFRLVLVKTGLHEKHRIEIGRYTQGEDWERSGLTGFRKFELYCTNLLNDFKNRDPARIQEQKIKMQLHVEELQKTFDDLMIGNGL